MAEWLTRRDAPQEGKEEGEGKTKNEEGKREVGKRRREEEGKPD